jgi:hypothetical protein
LSMVSLKQQHPLKCNQVNGWNNYDEHKCYHYIFPKTLHRFLVNNVYSSDVDSIKLFKKLLKTVCACQRIENRHCNFPSTCCVSIAFVLKRPWNLKYRVMSTQLLTCISKIS